MADSRTIIQSVQSWLPIKDIQDGIVVTTDNRYIKILEVLPINFLLRSARDQQSILHSFSALFKVAPCKLHFKMIAKRSDVEDHINILKQDYQTESNPKCRELLLEYIQLLKDVSNNEGISRRFFVAFEYENKTTNQNVTFQEIRNDINLTATTIIGLLHQCGNTVVVTDNDDYHIAGMFYDVLNRKKSESIGFNSYAPTIVQKYVAETTKSFVDLPYVPASEFFAPERVDTQNGKYIVVDGKYYTFGYVPSNKYNTVVYGGWMSNLVNIGEGVDVDLLFEKQNKEKVQMAISRKLAQNKTEISSTSDNNISYDRLGEAIGAGMNIKAMLATQDMFYMSILITIMADTPEDLEWKYEQVRRHMVSIDMGLHRTLFRMEQAFLSTLPLCKFDQKLFKKSKRNIMTSGASSSYMFTSYEMSDKNGILFGVNSSNGSLATVDIFNSNVYKNANMAIIGTSGSGKTYTSQCLAMRMREKKIQVFFIAPLKGHEYKRACVNIGGEYILMGVGDQCINIMEIRKIDRTVTALLDGDDIIDSSLVLKIQSLLVFFSLLVDNLSQEEETMLDALLTQLYASFGITKDNDSLWADDSHTFYKDMPILEDVYKVLMNTPKLERIATILYPLIYGSSSSFNGKTNVDLDNQYIVMDISKLQGKMSTVGMFVVLDYVWDKVKEDRTKRKAIFLDELWKLIGTDANRMAANYVLEIFKIIRGYGGSAIAATQDINDFLALDDGKYGKGIVNNSKIKIILQLEPDEAVRVQQMLNLTDSETMSIEKFAKGTGLVAANSNNIFINFKSSKIENALITTDRQQLSNLVQGKIV